MRCLISARWSTSAWSVGALERMVRRGAESTKYSSSKSLQCGSLILMETHKQTLAFDTVSDEYDQHELCGNLIPSWKYVFLDLLI